MVEDYLLASLLRVGPPTLQGGAMGMGSRYVPIAYTNISASTPCGRRSDQDCCGLSGQPGHRWLQGLEAKTDEETQQSRMSAAQDVLPGISHRCSLGEVRFGLSCLFVGCSADSDAETYERFPAIR